HFALDESALPLVAPEMQDFKPTGTPEPPLSKAADWLKVRHCIAPGNEMEATRETNTMPQWAGSCWYYLRYLDAQNPAAFCAGEVEKYWMNATDGSSHGVDLYVGGTEHAVLHLLYARFWHKVLFDLGYVSTREPFFRLVNQGLILGEDGQKMSKSRENVVNPDDVISEYGADSLRLYEMFMGPLEATKPWSMRGVEGVYRFLGRTWRLMMDEAQDGSFVLSPKVQEVPATPAQLKVLHATIKKVTEDIESMSFNTAISQMMIFVNELTPMETRPRSVLRPFLQLLAPFAPHIAEELWAQLHSVSGQNAPSLSYEPWPVFDPSYLVEAEVEMVIQVNGKVREKIMIAKGMPAPEVERKVMAMDRTREWVAGKSVKKVVVVPDKLVNIVVV
ncbi:MAG: class I tRNA ligase family protein, partial [Verrucomicrobiae bacterium]|nr:class I tRNA ligase family protein [Verrucomicrobiae bacterium]